MKKIILLSLIFILFINLVNADPLDFAGMCGSFGSTPSGCCPVGYTKHQILGNNPAIPEGTDYWDKSAYFCYRPYSGQSSYDFGGVFSEYFSNPLWAGGCPPNFNQVTILGSSAGGGWKGDYFLHVCFKGRNPASPEPYGAFGGMYSDFFNNPATNAKSCPEGYTPIVAYGKYDIDHYLYVCYPTCITPLVSFPEIDVVSCSDTVDNDCDGLIDCNDPDCSISCCNLLNAYWDRTEAAQGETVKLIVEGDVGCNGLSISFNVVAYEGATGFWDITPDPADAVFSAGRAEGSWVVTRPAGAGDGVYYYFTADMPGKGMDSSNHLYEIPAAVETICSDNLDDDGDGLIDCADPDCSADPVCAVDCSTINCADYSGDELACLSPGCCSYNPISGECTPSDPAALYCDFDGIKDVGLEECDPGDINDPNPVPDFSGVLACTEFDYVLVCNEYCEANCVYIDCNNIASCSDYQPDQCNLDQELCQVSISGCYLEDSTCNTCDESIISCSSYLLPETCVYNPCSLLIGVDRCSWDTTLGCIEDPSFTTAFGDYTCTWDCSGTSWSDCNSETGKRTRVGSCTPGADNVADCDTYAPPASDKSCLLAKKFPFFSSGNIIIVFILLITYYTFIKLKKKK